MFNINYLIIRYAEMISGGNIDVPQNQFSENTMTNILRVVFGIFGAVAVLVIAIGGLKMVMSRGNPQEVAKARETVIYAAVGLAVSVSAFTIVSFVVGSI